MGGCCTPKCCDNVCYSFNISDIQELLYGIDNALIKLGTKKQNKLYYNYCTSVSEQDIAKIALYKKALLTWRNREMQGGVHCVCPKIILKIIEAVKDIIPKSLCTPCKESLIIDYSNLDKWMVDNPYCVSYANWNKLSRKVAKKWGIANKLSDAQQCQIVFDVTKNIIDCEIIFIGSIAKKACELNIEVARTKEECKLDWEILLTKFPNCDISYKMYMKAIDNRLTYDMIYKILDTGCVLDVNDNECYISTMSGTTYKLSDIAPDNIPTKKDLTTAVIESPYLDVNKYICDYKLNKKQINKLCNG